jgi:hypothetical protein
VGETRRGEVRDDAASGEVGAAATVGGKFHSPTFSPPAPFLPPSLPSSEKLQQWLSYLSLSLPHTHSHRTEPLLSLST